MSENFPGKLNTLYSKRAGKVISFYIKKFGIILRNIVLKKIYFHGICALSKKIHLISRVLVRRSKGQILRVKNVKKKISRILKLPSWQHCCGQHGQCPP